MKISRVSNVTSLKRVNKYNSLINNVQTTPELIKQTPQKGISPLYYGRDLVSFKSQSFEQTIKENYFHLPPDCFPDAFQIEAGKALNENKTVLVEAPTGTGKTAVAYYAASKNLKEGKTTFYTTPLKALSNQKLNEFKSIFGEENVGILTGDRRENADAPIVIMTTEVYRNMALSRAYGQDTPLMDNLGTVIFDECHYLGDTSRGSTWEESIMMTPKDVQMLALSATVGNPDKIKSWMASLGGKDVSLVSIPESARHVPLKFDSFLTDSYRKEEKRVQKSIKKKGHAPLEMSDAIGSKPNLSDFKFAIEKLKKREQLPAIFFVFSRNYSRELLEYLGNEGIDLTTKEEKQEIERIVEKYKSKKYIGSDLDVNALQKGYAIHNAGIIPAQKELIEELFQKKLTKVVIATETLAAGINMPAKTVVISSPYKPADDLDDGENQRVLTANEFKQMAGRAGRRGIDTVGYVYTMPTDKSTEADFINLEVTNCNSLESRYSPEYSFLTGFYEYNPEAEELRSIYDRTFFAHDVNPNEKGAKIDELMDLSSKRTNVMLQRGFLSAYGNKLEVTPAGKMVSKVRGYDALTLAETIKSRKFERISPEALAMIAGGIANPAKPKETEISYETDLTSIFEYVDDGVDSLYKNLRTSVNSMLGKFGKSIDSFADYEEMLEFVRSLKKPEISEEEMREELKELGLRRSKMYAIMKNTGKYTPESLVASMKKNEIIPTKVLEEYLEIVERYKKRISARDIESYIERLRADFEQNDSSSKGKKAKARIDRKRESIAGDIKYAENMKYLDDHLLEVIGSNYDFIKHNPPQQVKNDYKEAEERSIRLNSKDALIKKIQGLRSIEEYREKHDISGENFRNYAKTTGCFNELIKNSIELYSTETENGIKNNPEQYGKSAAQTAYTWAYLNKVNPDTMSNWYQLLRVIPETDADEGSIYRRIMQTADLLSQIGEMAQSGYDTSETLDDRMYYSYLKKTAAEARSLLIHEPVEI